MSVSAVTRTVPKQTSAGSATGWGPWRRSRLPRPLTTVALIAAVFFTLGSIGSPLLGLSVFAGTDEIGTRSPYYDAGLATGQVQNTFTDDTYTAELPNTLLYAQSVRDGRPADWNPYVSGGIPLGQTPSYALWNPLSLPYYALPGWLAPAYEKLLEICCAIAGTFLFLRRLRLRRAAALLGGTVFASSAFMIVWTNWPQTRVAAFIPWVFWALERLIRRRRPTDAVLLALPVAFMLLGGFPAVTAFTLMTAAGYAAARLFGDHRTRPRRLLGLAGLAVAGVAGGAALAAAQLLPFASFYRNWLIEGRTQVASDHLSLAELATSFAPWTFGGVGSDTSQRPFWYLHDNMVEGLSYVGAAAAVLAVIAVALAGPGRRLLPAGAWAALVAAATGWLLLIYTGFPLVLVQHLPVFSSNFVGRARSVLGFLLAVLAAVGFELLLRRREQPSANWKGRAYGVAIWLAGTGVLSLLCLSARRAARGAVVPAGTPRPLGYATHQLAIGLAFVGTAVLCAAILYRWPDRWIARLGAAAALPALVVVQALTLVVPYYPRVPRSTFYPATDVQAFLAANLGHERFAGTRPDDSEGAMIMGIDAPRHLRALTGHGFLNKDFATLVRGIPEDPIPYPTYIDLKPAPDVLGSPILDALATKYVVTSPRDRVFGTRRLDRGDGTRVVLTPDRPLTVPVPYPGPLRAVGVTPAVVAGQDGDYPNSWLSVTVRTASGATVATARRLTTGLTAGTPFLVPVAADRVPAGTRLTAELTLHTRKPLVVIAGHGLPAVSSVSGADDGLSLAFSGSAVVYQRLGAQPRIRWAARAVVRPGAEDRVALLASGAVGTDEVVLARPGPAAEGRPATVDVEKDGTDAITTNVHAAGSGYLVVADADQVGWSATVDGKPAALVAADQGVVAVPVSAGDHTVSLHYTSPYGNAGMWISVVAFAVMIVAAAADRWILSRREPRAES